MFKRVMLYLLVLIITVTAFSPNATVFAQKLKSNEQKSAYALLGEEVVSNNLEVRLEDENKPVVQNRDGVEGWFLDSAKGNANRYIAVNVDKKFAYDVSDGSNFAVTVTYFDESEGALTMQYPTHYLRNISTNKYKWADTVNKVNIYEDERLIMRKSGTWKKHTWILERPSMADSYDGSDFKIGIYSDKMGFLTDETVLISKIEVSPVNSKSLLSVEASSDKFGNIFYTGEDMEFTINADNTLEPQYSKSIGEYEAKVICTIEDRYGAVYREKIVPIKIKPNAASNKVKVVFDDMDTYGLYKMRAKVVSENIGLLSSDWIECSYVRSTRGEVRNPHAGVCVMFGGKELSENIADMLYNTGFTYVGLYTQPNQYARTAYNHTNESEFAFNGGHSETIATFSDRFNVTTYIPRFNETATDMQRSVLYQYPSDISLYGTPVTEEGREKLKNMYLKILEMYGDSVAALFVFNEINIAPVLNEDKWAANMAEIQRVCYEAIKEKKPDMPVGGPQINLIGNKQGWLENFLKADGGRYMDFFTFHPYNDYGSPITYDPWKVKEGIGGTFQENLDLFKKYGVKENIPVYASEYGYSAKYYHCKSSLQQACWDTQFYIMLMQNGFCDVAFKFQINDSNYGKAGVTKENCFGIINSTALEDRRKYATAKEGLLAYSNVNIEMADAKYVERLDLDDGHTFCHRWKKANTGEELITLMSNLDCTTKTFDLGTDSVTVVDMYGNEKKISSSNGIYSFSFDDEVMYVRGNFKKFELRDDGAVRPSENIIPISLGGSAEIGIVNPTGADVTIQAYPVGSSSIEVQKSDSSVKILSGDTVFAAKEPIRVVINDGDKTYFDGIIKLSHEKSVFIESKLIKTEDGKWAIRSEITNTAKSGTVKGMVHIAGPSAWHEKAQDIEVEITAGTTQTVIQVIPDELESHSGDIVTVGFVTDTITMQGSYNSTKMDFMYANKAKGDVKIDGDLSDWPSNGWIYANRTDMFETVLGFDNEYTGIDDVSGKLALMWDDENLYLAGEVEDDVQYCENTTSSNMWSMDSLQLAIVYDPNDELASNQFEEVAVGLLDGIPTIYRHKTVMKLDDASKVDGAELEIKRNGKTTTYELKMPWKSIMTNPTSIKGGTTLKFGALINENDGKGRKGYYVIGGGIANTKNSKEFLKLYLME